MKTPCRRATKRLLLFFALMLTLLSNCIAQTSVLPPSKRVVINLGETPWRYLSNQDPTNAASPSFDDSTWTQVGVPYSSEQMTTYINEQSGGGDGELGANTLWYRKHFTMDPQYANSKVYVEFEGVHTGMQVFINGTLLPGNSAVAADSQATHVVGFIGALVDLTPYLHFDGTENVLAVRAARNANWFADPGFSGAFRFGQAMNGIFRPVRMYITDRVHIPQNTYSGNGAAAWGTYVSTTAASDSSATVDVQTNVFNESSTDQDVTLTVQIVDASGNVVASSQDDKVIPAGSKGPILASQLPTFDDTLTVKNPTLWYPNNSIYGKPYMYKVLHIVSVNGIVTDAVQSPLGIRTITWDKNFPYINGKMQYLWGGSGRYDYPALGSSVPEEQQWRDLRDLAAAGGNLYRPGHSSPSPEFLDAADAYGIMVVDPSGDGENGFSEECLNAPCDRQTLKSELHRDLILRDRNHPSVLAWEANNGAMVEDFAQSLKALSLAWDPIQQHPQSDRTPDPLNGDILSCDGAGCEAGNKTNPIFAGKPFYGAEYWDSWGSQRYAWDYELAFAVPFLDDWRKGKAANAFGMAQWYFADTPGEIDTLVDGTAASNVRNLNGSMTDINRFPRLLYHIYKAAWTPYQVQPVVALAHHWNRSGNIQVNAFSNCPSVRLLINGVQAGSDQIPNPWNSDPYASVPNNPTQEQLQNTTTLPSQVHWNVTWVPGTVTAECLDTFGNVQATDQRTTAGSPDHVQLEAVPNVIRPDGTSFAVTANGTDAALVVAKVVDANGVVVPTADNNITFSVTGPATYVGGSQSLVTPGQPLTYHSPGDPELQAEGGLQKIALRSQFTTGTVTVTATSPGLGSGAASFSIQPVVQSQPTATRPSIIAQPVDAAVTAGQPAHFSVTASGASPLSFQWQKNGNPITGAINATYDTPATSMDDNGANYSVVVTNNLGTALSNSATLSVFAAAAPAITTQPSSQVAAVGQTVQFSVTATGSPTLRYQWEKNGVPIPGATTPSYNTPVLTLDDNGASYTVVITNPVDKVTSSPATLTVNPPTPVTITSQPGNAEVLPGQSATFTVTVSGSTPIVYKWQKDGTNIGTDSPSLTINNVKASDAGNYSVTVTNAANSVTSTTATLALLPPGIDLALGKTATASSYENQGGMPANNAIDGDLTTRWGSEFSDPQWLEVDLGSVMAFNRVILHWENAYGVAYQIQYSNDEKTWSTAYTQDAGTGGTEDFSFPTVQARFVRLYGTTRATAYGYSLYEFSIYNAANCGASTERYTVQNTNSVLDNLSGLAWARAQYTLTQQGAQFTQPLAAQYCSQLGMRLPTVDEALAISGANAASCAFPNGWSTWTSTADPQISGQAFWVSSSSGTATSAVANNFPGWALCTQGTTAVAPVITTQPTNVTANIGNPASFSVVASGTQGVAPATYEWMKNGTPVAMTGVPSYSTPGVTDADNNAKFTVMVTAGNGLTASSQSAILTVTDNTTGGNNGGGGGTGTGGGGTGGGTGDSGTAGIPGFGNGPTPAGPNLALGKIATSSADESGAFPVQNAIDGNLTTRWSSTFVDPSWIQIDLGTAQPIGQVVLRWERAFGVAYQIQTSTDQQNWTTVFTQSNGQGGSENITFPTVNARYVRMYGTQRSSAYGYSLWEFEVYGPIQPAIQTQPVSQTVMAGSQAQFSVVASGSAPFTYQWLLNGTPIAGATSAAYTTPAVAASDNGSHYSVVVSNSGGSVTSAIASLTVTNPTPGVANLALGKPATSSGNENGGLSPKNAVDGDLTTRWSSAFVDASWIQVDLGTPTLINKVVLRWENAYGKAYQIQVSNDEQTWTTVYTQSNGQGGQETLTFPAVIDRYVRLYGTTRATQYGYSLFEFEIYGADVPSILTQPLSQTVTSGATTSFSIVAGGDGPFTYQWLRNGVAIPGATATSYTTPTVTSSDTGAVFTVAVTNANGTTVSQQAILTVNAATPTGQNLALHQPTKESGSENDGNMGSANAVDGSLSSRWSSAFVDPSWIEVDLGTAKTVGQVILRWENAYGKAYQIQVSNDEQTWTTVYTQSGGTGGVENIAFPPVSARYVRMYGTARATAYGYSLYEFEVYGVGSAPTITTAPASQTANVGSTATFNVVAGGTGPFTYQWFKNGVALSGATSSSYTTPTLAATDNGEKFTVTIGNAYGTVTSTAATLTVNNSGTYTIYPGFIGVDLNNNTNGAWADGQIYVTVVGMDPTNNKFAYLTPDGTVVDFTMNDGTAAGHLTKNGQSYGNYSFTLAQSKLLKIPTFISARAYISLGEPMYIQVNGDANGNVTGYAGPNPQNPTDPNINIHYDWYEFNNNNGIYINTTQVDQFGLPLLLDVWGSGGTFHKQVGITESIKQIDSEYSNEVPAEFQPATMSNLRILSPAKLSMAAGAANGHYFDNYIAGAWSTFSSTPLTITLSGRQFTGTTASSTAFTFTEVNPSAEHAGEAFTVMQPSTQDVLQCAGTMATGVAGTTPQLQDENAVQLQLQNQICSAINRHVLLSPADWTNVAAYYNAAPANFYSQFWHKHSIGGLAYGFSYDDNNDQSTTITTPQPEHMAFSIGW